MLQVFYVRKIQSNDYVNGYPNGKMAWVGRESVTAELPNPDMFPSNIGQLTVENYIPVNTGNAGESGAYILANSQDEALKWADTRL